MKQKHLTPLGRLRRQRQFVTRALTQYPIDFDRVDLISTATNFIYRARDAEGGIYALRLTAPWWRTEDNLRAEVAWLRALARDTDLALPKIVESAEGESYIRLHDRRLNTQRRAVLMTWLPGMLLAKRLNHRNVRKMGELFAKLHVHARSWSLPRDFPQIAFTGFLGRNEPNLLFDDRYGGCLPPHVREVLAAARHCANRAYRSKNSDDLCVIHCDLWHENIKIYRGELAPIDFEDTVLGYREHDIAMGLLDLAEDVSNQTYKSYLESFVGGYERVAPYPKSDILPFQLGRILWQLNRTAQFAPERLPAAAQSKAVILAHALDTGRLRIH
ncbi:MAG: phosphotransferase [Pseudomonadota bacterium]